MNARGCADGRKQGGYLLKDDVSSLTVPFDSSIASSAIDSHVMSAVVTVDVSGAYLLSNLYNDEQVFVVLRGKIAELLCQIDPKNIDLI